MAGYEGEQECINMTDERVSFEIAQSAGVRAMKYTLEPGATVVMPKGYCVPFAAAPGREERPSIIEQLTQGKVKPTTAPDAKARSEAIKVALSEAMAKLKSEGKLPGLDEDAKVPAEAPTASAKKRRPAVDADPDQGREEFLEDDDGDDFEVPTPTPPKKKSKTK